MELSNIIENECEKIITFFSERIGKIHANRISIENIEEQIFIEKEKPLKNFASCRISKNNELVVYKYKPQDFNKIKSSVLNNQIGHRFNYKKGDDFEMHFNLLPITGEKRKEFVVNVEAMLEKAKISFRTIRKNFLNSLKKEKDLTKKKSLEKEIDEKIKKYQDKLINLRDKKVKELNS